MSAEQREASLAMTAAELVDNWSAGKAHADGVALRGDFGAWLHRAVQEGMAPRPSTARSTTTSRSSTLYGASS